MNRTRKRFWMEILIASLVLVVLLAIMIPKFLAAQRRERANQLQAFINTLMPLLVENDAALIQKIATQKEIPGLNHKRYSMTLESWGSNVKILEESEEYYLAKSEICHYFKDQSFPYVSNDLYFGDPLFYLTLHYFDQGPNKKLAYFTLFAEIYTGKESKKKSSDAAYLCVYGTYIDADRSFQPVILSSTQYHPSNGLDSGGIICSDSYTAGWRVKAGTGPMVDELIQHSRNRFKP